MSIVDMFLQADPMLQLLGGLVGMGVLILIGRFVLQIAWKLVLIATLVVGVAYSLSILSGV